MERALGLEVACWLSYVVLTFSGLKSAHACGADDSCICTSGYMMFLSLLLYLTSSVRLVFFLLHHFSPMGPVNELQRCPSRVWSQGIYPSLPGSRLRIFYRDAGSALLHLVNQWLNFSYSCPHAFRCGTRRKITPAESRTHKFRLSGRTLYPLVHGII